MPRYYEKVLTPYMINKITRVFENIIDTDGNGLFEKEDVDKMVDKMRKHAHVDRSEAFYDTLASFGKQVWHDHQKVAKDCKEEFGLPDIGPKGYYPIDLDLFLDIRSKYMADPKSMEDLPNFIKDIPNIYFYVIDRNADDQLSKSELARYWRDYCHMPEEEVNAIIDKVYNEWTENGTRKLNLDRYSEIFEDFILSKGPTGPGRYFFGRPITG